MSNFNAPAVLEAAARRIKPIVDGLVAWWTGDAATTVSNGVDTFPSLAKLVADTQSQVTAAVEPVQSASDAAVTAAAEAESAAASAAVSATSAASSAAAAATAASYVVNRAAVRLATLTPLPSAVYANGSSGVGATLTMSATGVLTIDSVAVAADDAVLVAGQADQAQNGVYTCTTAGATGVAAVLTRRAGEDTPAELGNACMQVSAGTDYTGWVFRIEQASGSITIGTTAITAVGMPAATAAEAATRAAGDAQVLASVAMTIAQDATPDIERLVDAAGQTVRIVDATGAMRLSGMTVSVQEGIAAATTAAADSAGRTSSDVDDDIEILHDSANRIVRRTDAGGKQWLPDLPQGNVQDTVAAINAAVALLSEQVVSGASGLTRVVGTETFATSDTNLDRDDTTTGADQTAVLQAVLDAASTYGLTVFWNGAYSGRQIRLKSNTHIVFAAGCGYKALPDTGAPLIVNANESGGTPSGGTSAINITARNIVLEGSGIIHGNAAMQTITHDQTTYGWMTCVRFSGVRHLRVRDVRLVAQPTFAAIVQNFDDVVIERTRCELRPGSGVNTDGWHINGPGQNITLRDTGLFCADDPIAINADDGNTGNARQGPVSPQFQPGPITDVLIENTVLQNGTAGLFGVRILSKDQRIDRVTIRGIRGTTRNYAIIVDTFQGSGLISGTGNGNIGSLTIEDVDTVVAHSDLNPDGIIQLSSKIEQVTVRGVTRTAGGEITAPSILLRKFNSSYGADIGSLIIDGMTGYMAGATNPAALIKNEGAIGNLVIKGVAHRNASTAGGANGYVLANSGTINRLLYSGIVANNLAGVVDNTGTINSTQASADVLL